MRTRAVGCSLIALPALPLLAGCFGIPAATDPLPSPSVVPAPPNAATVVACTESGADAKDPKAREAICLKELGKQASRKRNVLSLKIDDGATKTFRTNAPGCKTDDGDGCQEYHLVGFYPTLGAYLVQAEGLEQYDNFNFMLVNVRTGDMRVVAGVPRLAPDNSTFFVRNCHDGCQIGVYSMSSKYRLWKSDTDSDWNFVRWIDNDQIALRIVGKSFSCREGDCEAILRRTGDSWAIEPLPPKSGVK